MRIVTIRAEVSNDTAAFFDAAGKEKQVRKELKSAVNDMAKKLKGELYDGVKSSYTIKSGQFRKSDIRLKKATSSRISALLTIEGGPVSARSGYRSRKNSARNAAKIEVKKGSGLKEIKMKSGNLKAFVTGVDTGHTGVNHIDIFQRIGKGRFPIKTIYGPGRAKLSEGVYEELREQKESELSRRLDALAARVMK